MAINPDAAGSVGQPVRESWTSKDALLYALGVGAGTQELQFTTENTTDTPQRVLPTFGVVVCGSGIPMDQLGSFNPAMMVHGEQGIELYDEIPPEGEIESVSTITGLYDKGSSAVVEIESMANSAGTGKPLFKLRMGLVLRGEGGWGGERGDSEKLTIPDRAPDHDVTYTTREDQGLIYRLSGDRNPLHSDPAFARKGGFDRPILHGLCSWGFTGRALLHTLCGNDPARFKSMNSRFSKPVFPGDDLIVAIWETGDGEALFQTRNQHGDIVIDQGRFSYA